MSLIVKYSEAKLVPPDEYVAKVSNIEPNTHPTFGDGFKWSFDIQEGKYAGITVTSLCSNKVSPKSKLYSWALVFGETPGPGSTLNLEDFIGRMVRIKTINKTSKKAVDGQIQEMTFSNVEGIAPYTPPADAPPAATPPNTQSPAPASEENPPKDSFSDDGDDFTF